MSIICKTGCGSQVVYQNIEFTDGFVLQFPHNLDESIHFCPIFYNESSLFTDPLGPRPFDHISIREDSYGDEIMKINDMLEDFDNLIFSKKQSISKNDITAFKTKLQSYLNMFPVVGLYTDTTDGLSISKNFEMALSTGLSSLDEHDSPGHSTLGSDPLIALKKIYYVLEGYSANVQQCIDLEKYIDENSPDLTRYSYEENPFESMLISVRKQLSIFEEKLDENPHDEKIKEANEFYHKLVNDVRRKISDWYQSKDHTLRALEESKKLGISVEKLYDLDYIVRWDVMHEKDKRQLLDAIDDTDSKHQNEMINLSFQEFQNLFPDEVKEIKKIDSFNIEHKNDESTQNVMGDRSERLFDLHKIRKLIYENDTKINSEELFEESDDSNKYSEIESNIIKNSPKKFDFNSHLDNNTQVHISNTELHLRQIIISSLYDNDINFMKKFFKQIWDEMDNRKNKQNRKISSPKEETELDYADMGNLLMILQNRETKKRVKSKNIVQFDDFVTKIGLVMDYRNQLAHNRGLINGDLEIKTKGICVGLCHEIDKFCVGLLYR